MKCSRHVTWFGPIKEFPRNFEHLLAESCPIGYPQIVWGSICVFFKERIHFRPYPHLEAVRIKRTMTPEKDGWPFSSTNTETLTAQFKPSIAWKKASRPSLYSTSVRCSLLLTQSFISTASWWRSRNGSQVWHLLELYDPTLMPCSQTF